MPAIADPGGSQRGYAPPRAPAPNRGIGAAPPAPAHSLFGSIGHAIQSTGRQAGQAAHTVATPRTGPPGGGSDALSSGPGYGSARANAYKQTAGYKQAVADTFLHQPAPQKAAIVKGLMATRNPHSPEWQAVQGAWRQMSVEDRAALLPHLPSVGGTGLGELLDRGLAGAANLLGGIGKNQVNPEANISLGGATPAGVSQVLTHAPIDIARATLQDPSVLPKTAKGLASSVAGAVAGTVELPYRMVDQGPGKALSQFGSSIASDYSRRYGPLTSGNDQAFINRIKQEGAGPEVFDAFIAAGGLDATAGRAIADIGKTKAKLSGVDNAFTRPRPELKLSGNKVRSQQLANTAGRIGAQRLEDKLRAVRTEKRPGEIQLDANQLAPIFQSHAIRVVHSGIAQSWRRVMQHTLQNEVRGRGTAALAAIGKLNSWQKQAIYHAVHGVRVDTPAHFREDLALRSQQIVQDRTNPASLGNRIPAQHVNQVDELALIQRLQAHAEKITGSKMVAFQRGETARAQRIEAATNLHPATSEARRLRATGDRLGIEHPDVTAAKAAKAAEATQKAALADSRTAPLASSGQNLPPRPGISGDLAAARAAQKTAKLAEVPRTERLAAYVAQVRAGMQKHGLPEPGYFKHTQHPDMKFGDFTVGSGHRAMPADKQSMWALHNAGVADHSAQAYLNGLARSVKRPYQWRLTDEQFRAAAHPVPTRAEIKAALGQNKAPHLLTGHELRQVLSHRGDDLSKTSFYNPGRLSEQTLADHGLLPKGKLLSAPLEEHISGELHHALNQESIVQHGDKAPSDKFLTTQGWKAVPRTAFDEIHAGLKGSSLSGRLVGKVQGAQAGLILGANPHFVIMNTLAHAIPAIAATKGAIIPDLFKTPVWWHGLSDAEKQNVLRREGGRGGHYNVTARLGSQAPNQIAAFGRKLGENGLAQKAQALNPAHAILKAEDIQSNFFRHAVMYHEIKRAAFQDMAHEYGRAVSTWEQVKHIFSLGPQERMKAISENMTKMEELGRTAVNILGDYGRFTARERAFFNNRAFMFYSFLRHVTRTLLYVLPARHPLALGLMGELGNLHVQEVKKMLGGQDLPWTYGRVFFDSKNKLRSIDMTSTSPISSPLVDVLSGGVKQLPRLISPALGALLDTSYGKTPSGQPVKQNAWAVLNDLFSLSYAYRQGAAIHFGLKPQQSDSVALLHERPQVFKTAAAQAYQAAKTQARGPLKDYLLGSGLGLYPKPDDSLVIAQHMAQKAASKGKGRGSSGGAVLPGSGSISGAVLPGSGGTGGAVLP